MNDENPCANTDETARDYDDECSSISGRSYNEEDDLCEPLQSFTHSRSASELENCKEYRASLSEDSSTSEASCDVTKNNGDCLVVTETDGEVVQHVVTSEEEDLDELFRIERDRMIRVRENVGGKQRPNSLPAPLNSKHPLADMARGRRRVVNGALAPSSKASIGPSSLNQLREWSISSYRCTRQALSERLGLTSIISTTCNPELQRRVSELRDSRSQCIYVSTVVTAMATHLEDVVNVQRQIARSFTTLSIECADLSDEFLCNAEANHVLQRNGVVLLESLRQFVSGIDTLCSKSIDDTLNTAKNCEAARLEYDAYRSASSTSITTLQQRKLDVRRETFEKLSQSLQVKIQLIEANRLCVMRKQLGLFHEALSSYFSGNRIGLETALKPFTKNHKLASAFNSP